MKIIKDNRPIAHFRYPFRINCLECKSELEVEEGDVVEKQGDSERGRFTYFTVLCPVCKYNQSVKPNNK